MPEIDLDERYTLAADILPESERDAPTVDAEGRRVTSGLAGVVYERLVSHVDHRGTLVEAVNFDRPFWDEPVVYSYCFIVRPGRVKGWGMHRRQADRYFLCAGQLRVVLYDGRTRSPTVGQFSEYFITESSPALLLIPPGVWHGDQNWGAGDAVVMNFPTRPFDRERPDKHRLDPHLGPIPFDWTLPDA
jgi:dTDP-4-dehydrorhamnose 3,5-epimerase